MIKVKITTEGGKLVEQPIDLFILKTYIEMGVVTAETEIWSDELTNSEWKKLGELDIYHRIVNKEIEISELIAETSPGSKKDINTENPKSTANPVQKAYGIPTGAIIAVISFFLPWVRFSCGGYTVGTKSGADLANWDWTFWLILFAALAIGGFYFNYKSQNRIGKCKTPTLICVLVAGLVVIYKLAVGIRTPLGPMGTKDLEGITPDIGIFGVVIGFAISFFSALNLSTHIEIPSVRSQAKFCVNCGSKLTSEDKFCSNCGEQV